MTTTQSDPSTHNRIDQAASISTRFSRRFSPERRVEVLVVVLTAIAAALILTVPDVTQPTLPSPAILLVVLAVGFAVTEVTVFKFTFRRESISFSISEIPLALSLVYLTPGPAVGIRLLGYIAVVIFRFRLPFLKVTLNLAMFTVEVALGFVVFRGIIQFVGSGDTQLVLAAIVTTAICGLVSSMIVSLAISQFEGGLWSRIGTELRLAWWLFLVNATLAGMVLGLNLISPYLVLVALVPLGVLWYIIKAYGALDQRLRDLDVVHGFTGQIGHSLDPDEIIWAAVAQTAEVLRTEGCAVVLFNDNGGGILKIHGIVGLQLPADSRDENWRSMIMSERAVLVAGADLDPLKTSGSTVSEIMVAPIRDESGTIGLLVVAGRTGVGKRFGNDDIVRLQNLTEQLTASLRRGMLHQRIEREARHDGLTGLPNRASFERSLADARQSRSAHDVLFVMMLDLDRFKEVNDTLGHHAGDDLLVEVGRRLSEMLQPGDVVARLAGDEFAIVAARSTHLDMVEFAWECVKSVGRPVTLDGLEIVVTTSAGVAVIEASHEDGAPLRFADIAMFNAKTQRLGVDVYRDEIDRRTPARLSMLGDLRAAIEAEDLHINLQPKLDLSSGTVVGAEALVRWTHSVRGVVPPTQFVRVAEDTGLIKQLTDLMLSRGIGSLRQIHDRGYHLGLSVNLSTHDLLDTKLAQRVDEHLSSNRVDASMLTLEITESSLLIDAPRAGPRSTNSTRSVCDSRSTTSGRATHRSATCVDCRWPN